MKRADARTCADHRKANRPVILPRDGVRSRQPRLRADDCTQNAHIKEVWRLLRTWLAPVISVVGFQGFVLRGAGREMSNFRNRNADYCSVIAKAVRMLGHSTEEARHRMYERARGTVLAEMSKARPPVDPSDLLEAQMCLEAAIKEIEADALRNQRARAVIGEPSITSPGANVLGAPAHQNGHQLRAAISRRWARVFRQAGERTSFRGKVLSDRSGEGAGRDPWLSELLARASREGEEDAQELRRLPR
jgi:hypothetical protein